MKEFTLAELLLRRKELGLKVEQLKGINKEQLYKVVVQRVNVTDGVDNVTAQVPQITFDEFNRAYDFYARRLRLIDAAIQQTNWTVKVNTDESVMEDYSVKK